MAKSTQRMPDLSNATPGGIVDMCAPDQKEMNRLDTLTKYYKTALKARLTDEMKIDPFTHVVQGEKFTSIISESQVSRLDMNKIRALLTEEQLAECTVTNSQLTIRFYTNEEVASNQKQPEPPEAMTETRTGEQHGQK